MYSNTAMWGSLILGFLLLLILAYIAYTEYKQELPKPNVYSDADLDKFIYNNVSKVYSLVRIENPEVTDPLDIMTLMRDKLYDLLLSSGASVDESFTPEYVLKSIEVSCAYYIRTI